MAQRVEQILKNLLSNAFKFTASGSVTLDVHRGTTTSELQRASLTRSTSHRLCGDRYRHRHRDIASSRTSSKRSSRRTARSTAITAAPGLGLTIARKFAHLLGGEIHVASEKGEGSTFTLFLPLALGGEGRGRRSFAGQSASPRHLRRTRRIQHDGPCPEASVQMFIPDDRKSSVPNDKVLLIIEDDRDFAATLMKIARKRGYKCLAAGDGKSGLLLAMEQPVTAIILDLRLPDIDGMRVLDQLKHDLRTRHIPVHIITGAEDLDSVAPLQQGSDRLSDQAGGKQRTSTASLHRSRSCCTRISSRCWSSRTMRRARSPSRAC